MGGDCSIYPAICSSGGTGGTSEIFIMNSLSVVLFQRKSLNN